jgi:hypothetical protein
LATSRELYQDIILDHGRHRGFESLSLQRGVRSEPDSLQDQRRPGKAPIAANLRALCTGILIDPSRVLTAAHWYNPRTQHKFLPATAGRPLH